MKKSRNQKLAIIVLGQPNSGKSTLWYTLFGRTIRSGWKHLKLKEKEVTAYLKNSSFEETGKDIDEWIFLQNASFEEMGGDIQYDEKFKEQPDIVFISVQYTEHGMETIKWLRNKGYFLYIQMITHGYNHKRNLCDSLGFEKEFIKDGEFHTCSGKEVKKRAREVKEFLIGSFHS